MTLALVPRPDEKLTPMERLEVLCDPGSIDLLRTEVLSRHMGEKARPGDGVLGASGRVDGRVVAVFAQDASFAGGSLGEAHAETVVAVLELAERSRVPVIGFVESAGARMQEGLAALSGYAKIFHKHVALSGFVPQISVICGPSAGGGSYAPALTDFVVMTEKASMFLTGPGVVAKVMGETVDMAELGGPRVHERNGVCHLVAETDVDAALLARDLLDYLPQNCEERPLRWPSVDPPGSAPDSFVPQEDRKVYDVRDVARTLLDGGRMLEISPRYARNIVCAFGRIDGRSVGVVANQPRYIGGVLDVDASQKAARFVRTCNLFNIPLIVLVDTPGFLPGTKQERAGVIRQGAKLVYAFSECTVPRITVMLRKAFGGAFIAMNSKELGADFVFAWPSAQLGVMGAPQAVEIIHRREIEAAEDPTSARDALASSYAAEHLHPGAATAEGYVDEVIAPGETRARLATALETLDSTALRRWPAGNIPL
ncbi:MAG TPA: acyl-CoA carboxylase subunit beta [Solirubrobacteraceae bacterium]|jgi:acetyl-CoA carboxylase carboxyltransferase component|nr:acyl-CoA carboxylase subunit beta [Solirubrobacteraceae bacterium]